MVQVREEVYFTKGRIIVRGKLEKDDESARILATEIAPIEMPASPPE